MVSFNEPLWPGEDNHWYNLQEVYIRFDKFEIRQPEQFYLFVFLAVFIGVFLQLMIQEKTATESL
ncbi:MAG: hypothetical protein LUE98_18870 [Tannerellaceae bacterium]|nr:hypothetical protein [Tannerellaceae bacterium]